MIILQTVKSQSLQILAGQKKGENMAMEKYWELRLKKL